MTRNEMLQWFILSFGLCAKDPELGHPTTIAELAREAKRACFDCDQVEVLDALYTLPRDYAALIKSLPTGEGPHPVSFERIRNTTDWPNYFSSGTFYVKVLPAGRSYYDKLADQMQPVVAR